MTASTSDVARVAARFEVHGFQVQERTGDVVVVRLPGDSGFASLDVRRRVFVWGWATMPNGPRTFAAIAFGRGWQEKFADQVVEAAKRLA